MEYRLTTRYTGRPEPQAARQTDVAAGEVNWIRSAGCAVGAGELQPR